MVMERLEDWAKERRRSDPDSWELPKNIIYYRDGVGTGQYNTIKEIEVSAIRKAFSAVTEKYNLSPDVNIHAVVVVKRHHTRFYTANKMDGDPHGNGNTKPGTFVDRLVSISSYAKYV